MARNILHCDMNNFYASVECMLSPELNSTPLLFVDQLRNSTALYLQKIIKPKHSRSQQVTQYGRQNRSVLI